MTSDIPTSKCKRCHRPIKIRYEGQEYGPTCARKMAGSHTLPDGTIEIRDRQGRLGTVIV